MFLVCDHPLVLYHTFQWTASCAIHCCFGQELCPRYYTIHSSASQSACYRRATRRRSAMWGALARQGGATQRRYFVQCSDDQRDRGAWRVRGRAREALECKTIERQDRAPRPSYGQGRPRSRCPQPPCGRDARAHGTYRASCLSCGRGRPRSRHPQSSCGRGRPRTRHAHSHRIRHAGGDARTLGTHIRTESVMRARRPRTWHISRVSFVMRAGTPAHPAPTAVVRAGTPALPARTFTPQPSCGRNARAPGARSRHAGATPAHLACTSCSPRVDRNEFRSTLR